MKILIILLSLFIFGCESLLVMDETNITQYDLSSYQSEAALQHQKTDILEIKIKPMGAGLSSNRVYSIDQHFRVEPIAETRWASSIDKLVGFHLSRAITSTHQFKLVTTRPGELVSNQVLIIELQEFHLNMQAGVTKHVSVSFKGILHSKNAKQPMNNFFISVKQDVSENSIDAIMDAFRQAFMKAQRKLIEHL